ncbi:rhodanese-like domain-containing protein [Virgibacillus necropolis]|uniref:Rhodanese n=1 Tax=Virgibacillus necropolis TaxID=163877 RepID=A0A221MGM0_9BACI|nr:rhodanese-like domain-containing protein [Virgibacillus necropolis]ASN06785.1 rhodanese [Virgibacillus necropolis]
MENVLVIVLAIIFYLLLKSIMPVIGVRRKNPSELRGHLKDKDKQFIDVRSPEAYKQNHIHGFENIPLSELSSSIEKLERSNEIVLISDSKRQMKKASAKMKRRGFRYVTTVQGGLQSWNEGENK